MNNPVKILAGAFTCCPPGKPGFTGGEDVLGWNILQQIATRHEVWVLTNKEDQASLEEAVKDRLISNVHFYYIGFPKIFSGLLKIQGGHQLYYYLWQVKACFLAIRLNKSVRFDIFHHITYGNDWMASHVGAVLGIPYVRGPGGGAHRTPRVLRKEYSVTGRLWERVRSVGQWIFRHDPFFILGQSKATALLVCNQDSQSKIPSKWRGKSYLFPVSGISTEDMNCASKGSDVGSLDFHILTAGSLIRIKGFGLAIKAFKLFSDECPNSTFTIIGSGPEWPKLNGLISHLNLESKVHLIPETPRPLLMSQMANCDVVLFPSMRDGGGTVVVEAMAVGKPVVCLDIGGPGMHINDSCGIKISPTTPECTVKKLSEALISLHDDRLLRERLGNAARERAEQYYHWDMLGDQLENIYIQAQHSTQA